MALIKCPKCGKEISDKAKKCPACGNRLKRNYIPLILIIVVIILAVMITVINRSNERKEQEREQERQAQIEIKLAEANELYYVYDLEGVSVCYDELDALNYDTAYLRTILDYDISVYDDVKVFYDTFKDVDDKLHNNGYSSLEHLINTLREPIETFDALKINQGSEFGKYIYNIRNNMMYMAFKMQYINGNDLDLDYGLTSSGYAFLIETYTERIVEEPFPYSEEE